MAEPIRKLAKKTGPGYVVHPGDLRRPLAPGVAALPALPFAACKARRFAKIN